MELSVEGLRHRYPGTTSPELLFPDHTFAPGSLTVVTGRSGSGKSTLLYIAALLLSPRLGTVLWDGDDVSRSNDSVRSILRARHVGFVFQDAVLDLARTSLENVARGAMIAGDRRSHAHHRARHALARLDLDDIAERTPGRISGGQAQRVAIARALVKDPAVVFADEPTGNLDDASALAVWGALDEAVRAGTTVIVATHRAALTALDYDLIEVG